MWPLRFQALLHWDDNQKEWRQLEFVLKGEYGLRYSDMVHLFKFVDLEFRQHCVHPWNVVEEFEGAGELPRQLIAPPVGFLRMNVFRLEVSVLVVPYLDSQLHRLSAGVLSLSSAETFLKCLCGIISLMCHAAHAWKLRLFNWQLCNVSTIGDPLLLDWEDTFRAPLTSGCLRVRSAFESFTEDLTHFLPANGAGEVAEFCGGEHASHPSLLVFIGERVKHGRSLLSA